MTAHPTPRRQRQPRGALGGHASPTPRTAWPWLARLQAGSYTVTATLDNPDYTAPAATGTLVIGQATPTITWSAPANITVGTPLGSAQLDATASFNGRALPGVLTFSPRCWNCPHRRQRPDPDGELRTDRYHRFQLCHGFRPDQRPTTPSGCHQRAACVPCNLNKKGKPIGKAVLTGFTLEFNMPLDAAAVSNTGNYQLETVTIKKVDRS